MGWNNPPRSWSEVERILSGRPPGDGRKNGEVIGDGGDSPAWTRRRERYSAPAGGGAPGPTDLAGADVRTPYAELHCHSNFSFLDGASHPEELVEAAALLGLDAIAITDHDGMYGVVRFAEAAKELGVRTVFGAELSLGLDEPQNGVADPEGEHLLLLATRDDRLRPAVPHDHHRPARRRQREGPPDLRPRRGRRRRPRASASCSPAAARARSARRCSATVPAAAFAELGDLVDRFGGDRVFVELIDHGRPLDTTHNDLLDKMAMDLRLPVIATNAVHYAHPNRGDLAAAMAAVRARRCARRARRLAAARADAPTCAPARRWAGGSRGTRARCSARRCSAWSCAFDLTLVAPRAAAVRGRRAHRGQLPACEDLRRRAAAVRHPRGTTRCLRPDSSTSCASSRSSASPATS